MPIICPSCERVPRADATDGEPCASCGTPLLVISDKQAAAPGRGSPQLGPAFDAESAVKLEPQWQVEKQARQAAATRAGDRPKRPLKIVGVIAALIAVAIVTTGVIMIVNHDPELPAKLPVVTEGTVTLEVRSNPPVRIRIDGHYAGKTPLTLHVPRSLKPVLFETVVRGRPVTRQVIPDRDQMVDFVPSNR